MHLTRFTDYGLRVLMYAALKPAEEKSRIADVAQAFNISRNHMMKIVNRLANEGAYLHHSRQRWWVHTGQTAGKDSSWRRRTES